MCKRALFHVCLLMTWVLAAQAAQPIGYWPFDGNLTDEAGTADGTFGGGAPTYVTGQVRQAIQFDGVDDYVAVTGGNLDAYTTTAWVKPERTASVSIVARTDASGPSTSWSHQMRISSTGVFEHYLWDGTSRSALGTTPVQASEWYFVAVRATNNDSMAVFVNGVREGTSEIDTMWSGGDRYHIGSKSGNSMGWYQGVVDELKIFDSALSDDEVMTVMLSTFTTSSLPVPADTASDVPVDVTLSWSAGVMAETHDVYLGTVFDDVNEATRDNPLGVLVSEGQTETTYDPEGLLEYGQTYYWRVDEVNAAPDYTIYAGQVWSFTVEPFAYPVPVGSITATASTENTTFESPENVVNGSGLDENDHHSVLSTDMWWTKGGDADPWIQFAFDKPFKLHQMLVWNHNSAMESYIGVGIREAEVEYSLDGANWTSLGTMEFAQATGGTDYAANTAVALDGVVAQYVKVSPISNWGGLFSQYGLSEVRFLYIPVVARDPQPADGDVDVSVASTLSWHAGREAATHNVYMGPDPNALTLVDSVSQASYEPGALDLEATYYWRVDEVNEAGAMSVWEGPIWSFATEEFLIVEDFEDYTNDEDAGKTIYQTWIDGYDAANTPTYGGSQVGHTMPPFAETDIVHGGAQSMPLYYDNTSMTFSQTTKSLSQDWTASGIKTLSLYFYGDPQNTGQLYLKINDTKVPYDGEATDIAKAMWLPWNVSLSTVNADLSKVTKLTIGIEGSGATGAVYIDDIRLYARDVELITPVQPEDANMIAYFTFDGNVTDSSGNGANGETHGGPTYVEGFESQAIQFDGVNDYVNVPLDVPENGCTVAFWLKTTMENCGVYAVVQGLLGESGYDREIYLYLGQVGARIYNTETITAQVYVSDGEWHHIAHMYGDDIGGQQVYVDGYLQASGVKAQSDFDWQEAVHFGWANEGYLDYFTGAIDEARIYNKTLTQAEVAWLAGGVTIPKPF